MLVSRDLIYLQMPKTGSTHVTALLRQILGGEALGKHGRPTPELLRSGRLVLASIRNPWDWYLSLWSYGAEGRGAVRHRLTKAHLLRELSSLATIGSRRDKVARFAELVARNRAWRRMYDREDPVASFRSWLREVHDPGNAERLGEGYGETALAPFCGFMTYRYLRLCCRDPEVLRRPTAIGDPASLARFERTHCHVGAWVRQEALEETLCAALARVRPLTREETRLIREAGRTNQSARAVPAALFYDPVSIELVRSRDRLIVEKFGYAPPA